LNEFEKARIKYKPGLIRVLLVAEAPPQRGSGRFFYFEKVTAGDSLFLETMKVLYPDDYTSAPAVRSAKVTFLRRIQQDGFYLIDASTRPMESSAKAARRKQLESELPGLICRLHKLAVEETMVVLISKAVYDVCLNALTREGFNVINTEMIDFPASSGQPSFRKKLKRLLSRHDWSGAA
jgi:hypothetical protein